MPAGSHDVQTDDADTLVYAGSVHAAAGELN